jgi:hypothetical protein
VNYDDAVRVVLAIRQGTLINRQGTWRVGDKVVQRPIPNLDASPVAGIAKPDAVLWPLFEQSTRAILKLDEPGTYEVGTQDVGSLGGHKLLVRVSAEGVELLAATVFEI